MDERVGDRPRRRIPPERKTLYYAGMGLAGLGFLSVFSVFITGALNFGNFDNFQGQVQSSALRAVIGMGLMIGGSILARIGARGLAGSGIVLDPEKAREDVEPWNRMAGGMTRDALSEIPLVEKLERSLDASADAALGQGSDSTPMPADLPRLPAVKVRCRSCRALNDEDARFCKQCGAAI
jgi:hypothetical protein